MQTVVVMKFGQLSIGTQFTLIPRLNPAHRPQVYTKTSKTKALNVSRQKKYKKDLELEVHLFI